MFGEARIAQKVFDAEQLVESEDEVATVDQGAGHGDEVSGEGASGNSIARVHTSFVTGTCSLERHRLYPDFSFADSVLLLSAYELWAPIR